MGINHTIPGLLLSCLCLLMTAGCASTNALVAKEPAAASTGSEKSKPDQPKAEQAKTDQAKAAPPADTPSGKVVNTIAAIVNDEVITLYEVDREAQPVIREAEKRSTVDDAVRSQIRRTALDRLIEKRLLEQKTRELNLKVSDEELKQAIDDVKRQNNMASQEVLIAALAGQGMTYEQYRSQLREQIEKLKLVSMEVKAKIHVSESEMLAYYEANQAKYTLDDTFRARHIFFKASEKTAPADLKVTMATALMVLAEAKSGKDFVELAKSYSEDPAARKDGGDLGSFKKGDMMPELEAAILVMKPGDVSELVYTPTGFHIIKLEERTSGKVKPFESVKAEIEETLYRKKSEERFNQWAKDLRSKASIEIKDLKGLI
jgi:peptidyl-prolyl cis-trans isomerase SurA